MGEELAAFFTSDAPENPCARCKKVVRNELLVYIKDRSGRKPGKNVCPACHDHIKSKGTTVQTGHQHEQQQVSQVQLPSDHQFIVSKQVAAAQRGEPSEVRAVGSIRPRRLSQERMPPPPLPAHSNHRPHVEVPGLPGRSSSDNAAIVTPRISISDGLGYQDAHKRYEETRLALRNRARNGSAHTVTVIARMATLTAGRLTPKLVENIMESIPDIPVRIGAIELKKIVFNALYPMFIQWSRGFHVPYDQFQLRDKTWVEIVGLYPEKDAISQHFIKDSGAKNGGSAKGIVKYKNGTTVIHLHLPTNIYDDIEFRRANGDTGLSVCSLQESVGAFDVDKTGYETEDCSLDASDESERRHPAMTRKPKRGRVRGDSASSGVSPTKMPKKRRANPPKNEVASACSEASGVSIKDLQNALKGQTAPKAKTVRSLLTVISVPVLIYVSPHMSYSSLVSQHRDRTGNAFSKWMKAVNPLTASLIMDKAAQSSYGAFKGMRRGAVDPWVFTSTSTEGNPRSTANTTPNARRVAIKQAFYRHTGSDIRRTQDVQKQIELLSVEIICSQWAAALLEMVYGYIRNVGNGRRLEKAPFRIPSFRFVQVALAITHAQENSEIEQEAFLLEEYIDPDVDGHWRKYVNNDSAVPLSLALQDDRERGEFLAFCQHVQYWMTSGLVFVSDFQGGNSLLSDPQIITNPDLGPLFGQGNVVNTHHRFEAEHRCNKFCKYFNIPTEYKTVDDDEMQLMQETPLFQDYPSGSMSIEHERGSTSMSHKVDAVPESASDDLRSKAMSISETI